MKTKDRSDRKLANCNPCLVAKATLLEAMMNDYFTNDPNRPDLFKKRAYMLIWVDGLRGRKRQEEYLRTGKSKAPFGLSMHNHGLALDLAFFCPQIGQLEYFDRYEIEGRIIWGMVAKFCEENHLFWGGKFKSFIDKPHISLKIGFDSEKETCLWLMTLSELSDKERQKAIEDRRKGFESFALANYKSIS